MKNLLVSLFAGIGAAIAIGLLAVAETLHSGAILLMAMGYDALSMNATNLPRVKSTIRSVSMVQAKVLLGKVMRMDDADKIQVLMTEMMGSLGLSQLSSPVLPE